MLSVEVQCAHLVAFIGMLEKQYGHSLVVGAGGRVSSFFFSLLKDFTTIKTANATIKKLITLFIKTP